MEFLNYHHLRYFWTVAKEGSFRQAAEKLRVSQPSISAQLRALEETLGEAVDRYNFVLVGKTDRCKARFYAITAERRLQHPAVLCITENAQSLVFA